VNCFTPRIIIILMETIKDLYISTHRESGDTQPRILGSHIEGRQRGRRATERLGRQLTVRAPSRASLTSQNVMLAVTDTLERCEPVVIAGDSFSIDDAGA
jgi:hypothetical protein